MKDVNRKPAPQTILPTDSTLLHDYVISLYRELQSLRQRVEVLERVNVHFEWLSREQAMQYLGCGSTKLWSLTKKERKIVQSGRLYEFKSCREYLVANSISEEMINQRLISLLNK